MYCHAKWARTVTFTQNIVCVKFSSIVRVFFDTVSNIQCFCSVRFSVIIIREQNVLYIKLRHFPLPDFRGHLYRVRFWVHFYSIAFSTYFIFYCRYQFVICIRKYAYAYTPCAWFIAHFFSFSVPIVQMIECECLHAYVRMWMSFRWSCQPNERKSEKLSFIRFICTVGECWNVGCHWSLFRMGNAFR